jgi:hypothetical protein
MSSALANPFYQLLGIMPRSLPLTCNSTVVVQGKKITDVRQIAKEEDDADHVAGLRLEVRRARDRDRYQRERQDPEKMAKRRAWLDANRAKALEYQRSYRAKNKDLQRQLAREWAKQKYHADLEMGRQKQRDYYAANRERILARLKADRDAARAEKQAKAIAKARNP